MTSTAPIQEWVQYAVELAVAAGDLALAGFGTSAARRKPDDSEVTAADVAIQEMMTRRILERCPGHAVIGEETVRGGPGGADPARARYCWVLDPLDGTRNYVRRFPIVGTTLALLDEGRPVLGVIRWHHTGQVFLAAAGGPAWLDGQPVRVSQRPVDGNLLVGAQLGAHHATQEVVTPWLGRWAIRNLGATALHLALVASGGLDAAYAQDCRIWDLAAGALLVECAGGTCTDLRGGPLFAVDPAVCAETNYPFIAGGPNAYPALRENLSTRAPIAR